jgi:O-antigen/teichoic acid export membrane protein
MGTKRLAFLKGIVFSYGTKVSMLVTGIAYTYLIANYLGPADYGIVSYYIALIISIISMGGIYFLQGLYNLFIPRTKSKPFFIKILKLQYCLAFLLFSVVFVFAETIAGFLHQEEFLFLRYAAFLLLLLPLHDSFIFLFRGFKFFGKVLKVNVVVSFTNLFLGFLLVISLSFGIYGVIYARIISLIIGIFIFIWFYRRLHFLNHIANWMDVKKYSYHTFMLNLFRSIETFSFTIFLGMFLSSTMLGLFFIAQKLVSCTVGSFQNSINEVVAPFVVEDYKDKTFLNRYLSYSIKLCIVLSVISVVSLIIIGKPLLELFFPSYASAYFIIVLYSIVVSIESFNILNSAFLSQNRMDILAKIYFWNSVIFIIFSLLLMPSYGVYGAMSVLMLSGIVKVLFLFYHLKELGLKIDFIIRKEDIRYFLKMVKRKQ